jgi:hypothetical protein
MHREYLEENLLENGHMEDQDRMGDVSQGNNL